jgi:hypothetical protein
MSGREVHQDDLECLAILQRRVNAGQGTARDLELIAARNDGGFHWKNDTYFKRLPDGSVRLRVWRVGHDGFPTYDDRTIDPASWASIVCFVSAEGETGQRWNAAQDFHGRC